MRLGEAMYQGSAGAEGAAGQTGAGPAQQAGGDDVVDAEFEDVEDKKRRA